MLKADYLVQGSGLAIWFVVQKDLQDIELHLVIASDPDVEGNGQIRASTYGSSCETFKLLVSVQ
ncbi:Protocadherin-16, partial [Manis pentadactyla]